MSLIAKLKLSVERPLVLLNVPKDVATLFSDLKTVKKLPPSNAVQVLLFAEDKNALDAIYDKILAALADNAVFWIAYPKQTGGIPSDLIRNAGWEIVTNSQYRIVSSVSIDDTWSAVRISRKKAPENYKSSIPMEERKVQGIDYVNRTVTLPEDALKTMKPYKGLDSFFYSMSFSHTREYIEAIEDAKKPETRARRIDKMIEAVSKLKAAKENKGK